MGIFRRDKSPASNLENPAEKLTGDNIEAQLFGENSDPIIVNQVTAFRVMAVYRCVMIISETIAAMPCGVYQKVKDAPERADDHPIDRLLSRSPNPRQTPFVFWQVMLVYLCMWGNAYAQVIRNGRQEVVELNPIHPTWITIEALTDGSQIYVVRPPGVPEYRVSAANMLHVPGVSFDQIKGIDVVTGIAKDTLSQTLNLDKAAETLSKNAMRPSGVVETDDALSVKALRALKRTFTDAYAGAKNAGQTLFLDNGMKWRGMNITPTDAQALESRRFQVAEIARLYGVPLFLLQETDKSSNWGTGLEQQNRGFLMYGLNPYIVRLEQEANRKLFGVDSDYYLKFNEKGLLRGDTKAQTENIQSAIQFAQMTPNEARKLRELPPIEGGDDLYIPVNLQRVKDADAISSNDDANPAGAGANAGADDPKQHPPAIG